MGFLKALLSGAAAAASVTLMHEVVRKTVPNAPRLDVLGMKAIAKAADALDVPAPEELRKTALAGDLLANTAYYSLVGVGGRHAVAVGAALGAAAGIGAVVLPGPMGLGGEETNRTRPTQAMAAGMYFAAGLIGGAVYSLLDSALEDFSDDSPLLWVP